MKNRLNMLVLLSCVAGIAACSQQTGPADALSSVDGAPATTKPAANEPVSLVGDGSNANADFVVDPGKVHACDGRDRVVSKVRWTARDPAVATVKVLVGAGSSAEKKTFTAGGNVGEAETGDWVVDGTHFYLVDGATDKELATYSVTALPCK